MKYKASPFLLLAIAFAGLHGLATAGEGPVEGPPKTITVPMKTIVFPMEWWKSSQAGFRIRKDAAAEKPEGYDLLFTGRGPADKAEDIRLLLKMGDGKYMLFLWIPEKTFKAVPQLEKSLYKNHMAFGPVQPKGYPAVTVHAIIPKTGSADWTADIRDLLVLPHEFIAGKLKHRSGTVAVGILDTTFDGRYGDICEEEGKPADLFLMDRNGDGDLEVGSKARESGPLTGLIRIDDQLWSPEVRDKTLIFRKSDVATFRLKAVGYTGKWGMEGRSVLLGDFTAVCDAHGCIELPREQYRILEFIFLRGDTQIRIDSDNPSAPRNPPEGEEDTVEIKADFKSSLSNTRVPGGFRLEYRLTGFNGKLAEVHRAGARIFPVFEVVAANGTVFAPKDFSPSGDGAPGVLWSPKGLTGKFVVHAKLDSGEFALPETGPKELLVE